MRGQAEVIVRRQVDYFAAVDAGDGLAGTLELAQALKGARRAPSFQLRGKKIEHLQSTGPMRHGTNSLWPRRSLQVRSPEATRRVKSKISRPICSTVASPSAMRPAL